MALDERYQSASATVTNYGVAFPMTDVQFFIDDGWTL
jgi:hypothetical protein